MNIQRLAIQELDEKVSQRLGRILEEDSAVLVTGLDQRVFDDIYHRAEGFFNEDKTGFESGNRLYKANGDGTLESVFLMYPEVVEDNFPGFLHSLNVAYLTLEALNKKILSVVEYYLRKMPQTNEAQKNRFLRIIKYHATADFSKERAPVHCDPHNILLNATQPGLEVLIRDEWHHVPVEHGSVIFIPGEDLQISSKKRIKSLHHKVGAPQEFAPRYSSLYAERQ